MRSVFYILITAFCFVLLSNCKVEKRLYRRGYHIVWNHDRPNTSKPRSELTAVKTQTVDPNVQASTEPVAITLPHLPHLFLGDTCGDKMLLQNADEMLVKIIEISDENIKYKRCDNLNGPTYSISKRKVAMITYVNGVKEVMMPEPAVKATNEPRPEPAKPTAPPKTNVTGLASLLLYIGSAILARGLTAAVATTGPGLAILVVLGGLLALILAYVALFQFKNEPGKYIRRWMPLTVVGINIAGLLIFAIALAYSASLYGGGLGLIAIVCILLAALLIGILISALAPRRPDPQQDVRK